MTKSPSDPPRDWRGTPILPGLLVVYGASVGRSVTLVEATVSTRPDYVSKGGRIWLDVVRRSYGHAYDENRPVHVGADRLTIVSALPPSDTPTEADRAAKGRRDVEHANTCDCGRYALASCTKRADDDS